MSKKLTNEEYIAKVKEKFGDKYDYSKTFYVNKRNKVTIICKEHGEFEVLPLNFLNGVGCVKCYLKEQHRLIMLNNIEKAKKLYNNFYDYSCVDLDSDGLVEIICPTHGKFLQNMKNHLSGHQCPKCSYTKNSEKRKRVYSYDELVVDVYPGELEDVQRILKDCMENVVDLDVKLTVNIESGKTWYDAK